MPNWHTLGRIAESAAYMGLGAVAYLAFNRYGDIWLAFSSVAFSIAAIIGFGRILLEITK